MLLVSPTLSPCPAFSARKIIRVVSADIPAIAEDVTSNNVAANTDVSPVLSITLPCIKERRDSSSLRLK